MIPDWAKELNCSITVCDKDSNIANPTLGLLHSSVRQIQCEHHLRCNQATRLYTFLGVARLETGNAIHREERYFLYFVPISEHRSLWT